MLKRSTDPDETLNEVSLGVASWRRYGVALVPLALAGVLPLWATAALCLIFALGAAFPKWHEARLVLALLIIIGTILPPFFAAFSQVALIGQTMENLFWQYGLLALALLLCYWGLVTLEDGRRRGLIYVLLAGLLAPQPLLVLALAGGALLRPGLEDHLPRRREKALDEQKQSRQVWLWLGAGVLGLTLLATFLPRYVPHAPVSTHTQTAPQEQPTPENAQSQVPKPAQSMPRSRTEYRAAFIPMPPIELTLGLTALSVLLFMINLIRVRPNAGERIKLRFYDVLLLVVIGMNFALVLVLSLLSRRAAPAGEAPAATQAPSQGELATNAVQTVQASSWLLDGLAAIQWGFLAVLLGLLAFLAWSLFMRAAKAQKAGNAVALAANAPLASADEALNRIRIAYRDAEDALTLAGRARQPSESPLGYAARLSVQHPELAEPLWALTQLYLPVRYGGQANDDQAENAEQQAQLIARLAAQLPPLTDPKESHD